MDRMAASRSRRAVPNTTESRWPPSQALEPELPLMDKCCTKRTSAISTGRRSPVELLFRPEVARIEPDLEDTGRVQTLTQQDPVHRQRMAVGRLPTSVDHPRTAAQHLPDTEVVSTKANRPVPKTLVRTFPALVRELMQLVMEQVSPAWRAHLPAVAGACTANRTANLLGPTW